MVLQFLLPGAPEGSTSSGSGFKASQKSGHAQLKVSSYRLGEPGIELGTRLATSRVTYPLHNSYSLIKDPYLLILVLFFAAISILFIISKNFHFL